MNQRFLIMILGLGALVALPSCQYDQYGYGLNAYGSIGNSGYYPGSSGYYPRSYSSGYYGAPYSTTSFFLHPATYYFPRTYYPTYYHRNGVYCGPTVRRSGKYVHVGSKKYTVDDFRRRYDRGGRRRGSNAYDSGVRGTDRINSYAGRSGRSSSSNARPHRGLYQTSESSATNRSTAASRRAVARHREQQRLSQARQSQARQSQARQSQARQRQQQVVPSSRRSQTVRRTAPATRNFTSTSASSSNSSSSSSSSRMRTMRSGSSRASAPRVSSGGADRLRGVRGNR
ncbi:MAG: hypothetical protein AAF514_01980 [Verrucomicrobiota bacterium]